MKKTVCLGHYYFIYTILCIFLFIFLSPLQVIPGFAENNNIDHNPVSLWTEVAICPAGLGTVAEAPFQITSAEELAYLATLPNIKDTYSITIMQDINLSGHQWKPIDIGNVSFEIYGNNHIISNMTIEKPGDNNAGFFGQVYNLTIYDLHFNNAKVVGNDFVGIITGYGNYLNRLINCSANGSVYGNNNVGALSGQGRYSDLTFCYNRASVTGFGNNVGGLVGRADSGNFVNCQNYGNVLGGNYVGGLTGYIDNPSGIERCLVNCMIEGRDYIGGICGMGSSISNSIFRGSIRLNGNATAVGTIVGAPAVYIWGDYKYIIRDSFAIAEIVGQEMANSIFSFGAPNEFDVGNSYFEELIFLKNDYRNIKIYKLIQGNSSSPSFENWTYSPYVNGGYPFQKNMFSVGAFLPVQNVETYLQSFGFTILRYIK